MTRCRHRRPSVLMGSTATPLALWCPQCGALRIRIPLSHKGGISPVRWIRPEGALR